MNQLEKTSLETIYSAKRNSGCDNDQQSAVAVPEHNVVSEQLLGRTLIPVILCGTGATPKTMCACNG